ncbi:hypothetical protein SAMN05444581_1035 [Methylocapsa palsarum]|uniref:Uncharacterized protein n=1 Tax=Methylocapsa palsarum TaxID=1612308 RepID=A0A1I3XCK7_9HYPH|nr:hypothetical protein SAMN05444581_1035 [Methylocapsa palsarum]
MKPAAARRHSKWNEQSRHLCSSGPAPRCAVRALHSAHAGKKRGETFRRHGGLVHCADSRIALPGASGFALGTGAVCREPSRLSPSPPQPLDPKCWNPRRIRRLCAHHAANVTRKGVHHGTWTRSFALADRGAFAHHPSTAALLAPLKQGRSECFAPAKYPALRFKPSRLHGAYGTLARLQQSGLRASHGRSDQLFEFQFRA